MPKPGDVITVQDLKTGDVVIMYDEHNNPEASPWNRLIVHRILNDRRVVFDRPYVVRIDNNGFWDETTSYLAIERFTVNRDSSHTYKLLQRNT